MTSNFSAKMASSTYPDGSDAANYTVNWHAPYEAYEIGIDERGKDVFDELFSGISPGGSGNQAASKGGEFDAELFLDTVLVGFAIAGQEEAVGIVEVCCHICHITQFALHYDEEPAIEHGATNGPVTWQVAQGLGGNINSRWADDPNGWTHCNMSWKRVVYWEAEHYNCDKYGHNGWMGRPYDCYAKQYTRTAEEPYFDDNGG